MSVPLRPLTPSSGPNSSSVSAIPVHRHPLTPSLGSSSSSTIASAIPVQRHPLTPSLGSSSSSTIASAMPVHRHPLTPSLGSSSSSGITPTRLTPTAFNSRTPVTPSPVRGVSHLSSGHTSSADDRSTMSFIRSRRQVENALEHERRQLRSERQHTEVTPSHTSATVRVVELRSHPRHYSRNHESAEGSMTSVKMNSLRPLWGVHTGAGDPVFPDEPLPSLRIDIPVDTEPFEMSRLP